MKKILIVNNNMQIGGVQKALVSLLENIQNQYDVTLLLFQKSGACVADIPSGIKVITADSHYRYLGMAQKDTKSFGEKLCRGFYAAIARFFGRKYAVALMGLSQKKLKGYDVAISYLHNAKEKLFYGGCNDFVLKHVDAAKKVAFLHCDYLGCGANTKENAKQYSRFDAIAACSQGCADIFLQANPDLAERVKVVPNCHRFEMIQKLAAEAAVSLPKDRMNVVTVARLAKEKGVDRALRVLACLGELKAQLHYYIVGDGPQKAELLSLIEKENLSDCVTLCGMLNNPYGYIQAADLLLIPSDNEAAPLVIGEAASLGTPVLSMETSSAREMIQMPGIGWVCENSEEAMAESLRELLMNPAELETVQNCLENYTNSNQSAVNLFQNCIC